MSFDDIIHHSLLAAFATLRRASRAKLEMTAGSCRDIDNWLIIDNDNPLAMLNNNGGAYRDFGSRVPVPGAWLSYALAVRS